MKTIRQSIIEILKDKTLSAVELSHEVRVKEKEIYEHLSHISKTTAAQGKKLSIDPARCLKCGYVFKDRRRFTPPGRCPRCRDTYITLPMFRIV
jgi:predicted Zn-ribbon and HTH transcriptional regulator